MMFTSGSLWLAEIFHKSGLAAAAAPITKQTICASTPSHGIWDSLAFDPRAEQLVAQSPYSSSRCPCQYSRYSYRSGSTVCPLTTKTPQKHSLFQLVHQCSEMVVPLPGCHGVGGRSVEPPPFGGSGKVQHVWLPTLSPWGRFAFWLS